MIVLENHNMCILKYIAKEGFLLINILQNTDLNTRPTGHSFLPHRYTFINLILIQYTIFVHCIFIIYIIVLLVRTYYTIPI